MRWIIVFTALFCFSACKNKNQTQTQTQQKVTANEEPTQMIQYSEKVLISLLDSIGELNPTIFSDKLNSLVDSTLNNQVKLRRKIDPPDFEKLKSATKVRRIEVDLAKRIFPNLQLDSNLIESIKNGKIPIVFYSFDRNKKEFNEFAISIGSDDGLFWSNDIYFFKSDTIISKHNVFHHYGINLQHFKNEFNETVIYYTVNYESGTGIWWNQINFYRYDKGEVVPALTEIENANLQYPWSIRAYFIESAILKTNPLTLKFTFNNLLKDSLDNEFEFINDSTEVVYRFDSVKNMYEPTFGNAKLSKLKLLTYFIADNELLFVYTNYELFKTVLNGKDKVQRQSILHYLNDLKNGLEKY